MLVAPGAAITSKMNDHLVFITVYVASANKKQKPGPVILLHSSE